jgi:hypothetical protein
MTYGTCIYEIYVHDMWHILYMRYMYMAYETFVYEYGTSTYDMWHSSYMRYLYMTYVNI